MISMVGSKSKQDEEYMKSKTKSCQPRRKWNKKKEPFEKSTLIYSWNHRDTFSKIIYVQHETKLGQFIREEIDAVLKIFKVEKLHASTKYFLKVGKQERLTTYFFDYATLCINKEW